MIYAYIKVNKIQTRGFERMAYGINMTIEDKEDDIFKL